MAVTYRGENFLDTTNQRTPKHPTKSHAVLAKEVKIKLIRFGQQGVSGAKDKSKT